MDDLMTIRHRVYTNITNSITKTLTPLLVDKSMKLQMIRSGVTVEDTRSGAINENQKEIFTILCDGSVYGHVIVDKKTLKILQANISSMAFFRGFNIFDPNHKKTIEDYMKSLIGLRLDLNEEDKR